MRKKKALWRYRGKVRAPDRAKFLAIAFVRAVTVEEARNRIRLHISQHCLRKIGRHGIKVLDDDSTYPGLEARRAIEEAIEGAVGFFLEPLA